MIVCAHLLAVAVAGSPSLAAVAVIDPAVERTAAWQDWYAPNHQIR